MSAQKKTGLAVLGIVVLGMLTVGWFEFKEFRAPKQCSFCQRPLQDKLRVVVEIGGQRREACCPQCAVSESRQISEFNRYCVRGRYEQYNTLVNWGVIEATRKLASACCVFVCGASKVAPVPDIPERMYHLM